MSDYKSAPTSRRRAEVRAGVDDLSFIPRLLYDERGLTELARLEHDPYGSGWATQALETKCAYLRERYGVV